MRAPPATWGMTLMLVVGQLVAPTIGRSDCPPAAAAELLDVLPLATAWRTRSLELPVPESLYRLALERPGAPALRREGKLAQAVVVADLPVERLWMAINDDSHHAVDDYLPLEVSRVLAGDAGRPGRETLQAFARFGMGRWWVIRLETSPELYEESAGRLWELRWKDAMERYPLDQPPIEITLTVGRLESSEGAWLLVPLGERCTLVEYVATGEPGGFMGVFHWLVATRALRSTVEGMVELARSHLGEPHHDIDFERPDGSRFDAAAGGEVAEN